MVFFRNLAAHTSQQKLPVFLTLLVSICVVATLLVPLHQAMAAPAAKHPITAVPAPEQPSIAAPTPQQQAMAAPVEEQQAAVTPVAPNVWLAVDTDQLSLAVMQGNSALKTFENIAIGSSGTTLTKHRGDGATPLGEFTITQIRPSDRFKLFMALSYPNLDHTERAYQEHRINAGEYKALRYDLDHGRPPSQGTSLGGELGIHGVGRGDIKVHESVNWTEGCIALTNEQLAELAKWVAVGTRVVVR